MANERPTRAERKAHGKSARAAVPLDSHRVFEPAPDRDPVGLLLSQAQSRVPELVPIRHGRMLVSPFTYFRGAALPMAADLATTPTTDLRVQLCGDAHLSNFGAFAAPDRQLVFDVNDFDETLPGPFEWDVKRLAASLAVAGRDNQFTPAERRTVIVEGARRYRTALREFADMPLLDVWYARLDIEKAMAEVGTQLAAKSMKRTEKALAKARTRDSMQALSKLTTLVEGRHRIVSDPPLIVPVEDLFSDVQSDGLYAQINDMLTSYQTTLQSDRRYLLQQFDLIQMARKVVGVGSVGTRAWILLLAADDGREPLFLQAKEAQTSVLAGYCGAGEYTNEGQRVVAGQHLMQAASDIFLGWQRSVGVDGLERDYYVRQLRDWKFSFPIEQMVAKGMAAYAGLCGWTLARAHACSGDRVALAAYLGKSDVFETAIAEFAEKYADQNERDFAALDAAVTEGRAQAQSGL
ncbi:DUF2252 domain-containing protein [Aldersonia sp. NBC_00410]|uniref:DUF2252 domain-containing protein n=1 Tax=Aldersonia sp. NBC_00410 TaxID=2975954 RepID=UPI00225250F2|nr:DUF2252 domain-containing protein [Aldersonia sp. NBC_00410]MCX5041831.1 DUF2252 domain-containing protein [Aldersonia sp. NBC_00410]